MNKTKQRLTVGLLVLGSFGLSALAHAKSEFPSEMARNPNLNLSYQPPCSVCHIDANIGSSTPITPFALSLRARGLTGQNSSLSSALSKLEADAVDSDGDGTTDVAELKRGTDPNSSANASIKDGQEPGYGCGGTAPHGRSAPGAAGVLTLGWFLLRRRRGQA
ncbi:MAG TPA: thrombospondin type 3 repeat-containing protein [Polyangiaceae bacterium]